MAFNKKNKRPITVTDQRFYWSVTGGDGYISLMVMTEAHGSGRLSCNFDYHQDETKHEGYSTLSNQFVVTPYIVRQAIEHGLKSGWQPFEKSPNLSLGPLDDKIDLRLDQNRELCFRQVS